MSLQIEYTVRDGIVVFCLRGKLSLRVMGRLIAGIGAVQQAVESKRLLVDARQLTGRLDPVDTYKSVQLYPRAMAGYRVAVVETEQNLPDRAFHEDLAQRRGFGIAFFAEMETAEAWLRETSACAPDGSADRPAEVRPRLVNGGVSRSAGPRR